MVVGDAVEDVIQRGEADLALGASFAERGGLMLRPLFRDPFVVAIAAEHAPGRLTLERYLAARHVLVAHARCRAGWSTTGWRASAARAGWCCARRASRPRWRSRPAPTQW
ncbi:LysR substrate-binding domain-containing protein [Nannocystis pusilla]|uniref:LysR substrate-binding domain-containing protein n=1 Tax=Nannocystis pusilla TaxID=889268 RepID=UPI003B7E9238